MLAAVLAELAPAYGPERPIILIVPLAPGGPIDIIARIVPMACTIRLARPSPRQASRSATDVPAMRALVTKAGIKPE